MFWALCQCKAARIIKLWSYFSRSHELFLIPVSSLPVLAECPLDNHSHFWDPSSTHISSEKPSSTPRAAARCLAPAYNIPWECYSEQQLMVPMAPSPSQLPWSQEGSVLGNRIRRLLAAAFQGSSLSCYFPYWFRVKGYYTVNDTAWLVLLLRNYRAKAWQLTLGADTRV